MVRRGSNALWLIGVHRPTKAAVAQAIVRAVVSHEVKPGDILPPERTMLERCQIGRATLRGALRLLESQGVDREFRDGAVRIVREPAYGRLCTIVPALLDGLQGL